MFDKDQTTTTTITTSKPVRTDHNEIASEVRLDDCGFAIRHLRVVLTPHEAFERDVCSYRLLNAIKYDKKKNRNKTKR